MRSETDESYRDLCRYSPVSYSSFMRWRGRMRRGEPVIYKPGPKKIEPFDFDALRSEVAALSHCRRRTRGTGELYLRHSSSISRRDLQGIVAEQRCLVNWIRRNEVKHLSWHVPCSVWAIDDTEERKLKNGQISLNDVRDMASRYELPPAVSEGILPGQEVAKHLEGLIKEYGAPLFLKRDHGSNLNCAPVDDVLSRHLVIPLNSPVRYPQYNGSIEQSQWEMQRWMEERLSHTVTAQRVHIASLGVAAAHTLNHRSRPCLDGKTACEVFSAGRPGMKRYDRRKRKEVYDWIKDKALAIMDEMDGDGPKVFQKAWRTACEIWLQANGLLTVSVQAEVLPEKMAVSVS